MQNESGEIGGRDARKSGTGAVPLRLAQMMGRQQEKKKKDHHHPPPKRKQYVLIELEESKTVFSYDTLARDDASLYCVWLQKVKLVRRYCPDRHSVKF